MWKTWILGLGVGVCAIAQQLAPSITIDSVPDYGITDAISGTALNVTPQSHIVAVTIFIPDLGWYSRPGCSRTTMAPNINGTWSTSTGTSAADGTATIITATLFPAGTAVPCLTGAPMPAAVDSLAVARAVIRRPPFLSSFTFSGLEWLVKSNLLPLYPGPQIPNLFKNDGSGVSVDAQGRLHLRIHKSGGQWISSEIFTRDSVGLGQYRLHIASSVGGLDPNTVLGFFTWSDDAAASHREMDIEISRWGQPGAMNAQFAVQPYDRTGNLVRFNVPSTTATVHGFEWTPGAITFSSGTEASPGAFQQWTFDQAAAVPPPGSAKLHLNFYLKDAIPPADGSDQEVIISSIEYLPSSGASTVGAPIPNYAAPPTPVDYSVPVQAINSAACSWNFTSSVPWIRFPAGAAGQGAGTVRVSVGDNPGSSRSGTLLLDSTNCGLQLGMQSVRIDQAGNAYIMTPRPGSTLPPGTVTFAWSPVEGATGYRLQIGSYFGESDYFNQDVTSTSTDVTGLPPNGRTVYARLYTFIGGLHSGYLDFQFRTTYVLPGLSGGLAFIPVTPCRVMDTRTGHGIAGAFGPPTLAAQETRTIPIPHGACNIPNIAQAYSLNVTVVPKTTLGYLTLWPAGTAQPLVSTLNAPEGGVVANAAIVPAGLDGAVSVYVTSPSDVVIDVNGYFTPLDSSLSYSRFANGFLPLSPCRLADTRNGTGAYGGPQMFSGQTRTFLPLSGPCWVPPLTRAYSLNVTVVPKGSLGYLTFAPTGYPMPVVSTLNSPDGSIRANAAIVPSGTNSGIDAFVTDNTDLVLDLNGSFVPVGTPDALAFTPVAPCRIVDTRNAPGAFGGPVMDGGSTRYFPIWVSSCGISGNAKAYSLNITVVPLEPLGYLTAWPASSSMPFVSTLNSPSGRIVANAAIVPADSRGAIQVFVTNRTHVIIDINGYFAP